jgi:release factor glutamine methyltransferase
MMNVAEWLALNEARLRAGPHPERARFDAGTLLLYALGRERAWLMAHPDEELGEKDERAAGELLDRRLCGEPIQYITGEAEFYGLPFRVNRDVLIPRPETEHVVEEVLELASRFASPRIVDVGTGSGAIAVALAHHLPKSSITATDCSAAALEVARANARHNGVAAKVRFLAGDLLAPVAPEQFEIVVSNPPYVPESDRASLAVEVREFEPATALFAAGDGLSVLRRLISKAREVLVPGGWIALEIGQGQAEAVHALLADAGFAEIGFVPDLQGIPRVASARRG